MFDKKNIKESTLEIKCDWICEKCKTKNNSREMKKGCVFCVKCNNK